MIIFSVSLDGTFMSYLTVGNLFQSEAAFALNQPVQFGVREVIETVVYSLIMEGAIKHFWEFQNEPAGEKALAEYVARRDKTFERIAKGQFDSKLMMQKKKMRQQKEQMLKNKLILLGYRGFL